MTKALWFSLAGGVTGWTVHLLVFYFLADLGCVQESGALWVTRNVLTLLAVAAVGGTVLAARPWSRLFGVLVRSGSPPDSAPREREGRFLETVALALNTVFLFAVVFAGATNLFLAPC